MKKDFDTYIFDLDGTLLDTLGDLTASLNHILAKYGLPRHSAENVRRMVGNGISKLVARAIPDGSGNGNFDGIYKDFMNYYMLHSTDTTRPYDGISELLEELKRRGKKMAIVSNKHFDATEKLRRHFFAGCIDVAIGERTGIRRKPAPDTVFEALRRLGAEAEGAVYVGDSDVDIMTASASGIPCVSVLWGFRDRDFLAEHGAEVFVEKPADLLAL